MTSSFQGWWGWKGRETHQGLPSIEALNEVLRCDGVNFKVSVSIEKQANPL
ncbi:hypothetical protein [Hydrogenophaga taeniospiralis]|uniref:hypothetical protein n=1 Tax=Hydrogenophaga taeniospiralis TaxID=65656 RepID=UPI000AD38F45|nr:hypothetical protein [Hydrogenophaga taeniospiralis]